MRTADVLRLLAASAACAALVGLSGCGGATQNAQCTVDEDALAERIADRVYEQLRERGYLQEGAGAGARVPSSGGDRTRTADDGDEGGAITPRNIVNALRRGLQDTPSEGADEP